LADPIGNGIENQFQVQGDNDGCDGPGRRLKPWTIGESAHLAWIGSEMDQWDEFQ